MTIIVTILIILAVLLAVALIWTSMKRKKDQVGRERASELRSEAATTAAAKQEQEARAREAEAEAERVRAQADKLEVRAQEERTSYDMTQARQEDSLREADRLDPDVDHRSTHYTPDLNGSPVHGNDTRNDPTGTTPGTTRATGWTTGWTTGCRPGPGRSVRRAARPTPCRLARRRSCPSTNRTAATRSERGSHPDTEICQPPTASGNYCSSNPENTSQTGVRVGCEVARVPRHARGRRR